MRQSMKFLLPTLATALLLSACGSSSTSKSSSSAAESAAASQGGASASGTTVKTASNAKLGRTVLVDARGMTLYHLSVEQNGKFICTSAECTQIWHPLTVQAGATPSGTVGSLGMVKRPDGSEQVTYKGMPLYTFAQDHQAGQANGQGVKDVGTWSAATTSSASSSSAAGSSSGAGGGETSKGSGETSKGGGGYGY
jgi:predicted lipoprotein with Yx(FWY)xxD motif